MKSDQRMYNDDLKGCANSTRNLRTSYTVLLLVAIVLVLAGSHGTGQAAASSLPLHNSLDQVTGVAVIVLSPSSGMPATSVQVTGTGFLGSDTSCSLSGTSVTQSTCSVTDGTLNGAFTVANSAAGFYTVTATASPGQDSASANFEVTAPTPSITVNPTIARAGASVRVTGSSFSTSDSSCSLAGGAAVASETCSIGNGALSASFVVASAPAGAYAINVTGSPTGDFASAQFTLTVAPITITLNPAGAPPGTTVQVSGSGFSLLDTSCSLGGVAASSSNCLVSGGTLTGSFTVSNVGPGYYTVSSTGSTGDTASTNFAVGPTNAPAIPGFPAEAILAGMILGLATLALLRRKAAKT